MNTGQIVFAQLMDRSLYEILQILSITIFEKMPVLQAITAPYEQLEKPEIHKQLLLFDF